MEVVITKDEVDHLVNLCREEIDSVGRITAGILRLLKLDESVGPATLKQLSNLGKFLTIYLIFHLINYFFNFFITVMKI